MKSFLFLFACVLALVGSGFCPRRVFAGDAELTGREIMERVNKRPRSKASVRRMILTVKRSDGRRLQREIVMYQIDDGQNTKTLFTVAAPAELRGLGVLRWEGIKGDSQWLHAEGLREVLEVDSRQRDPRFFGTDFTLSDTRERLRLEAYSFTLKGETGYRGRPSYIVKASVLDDRLGYSRVVGWVDSERWLILKAKYYDVRGRRLKVFEARQVSRREGFWEPHILAMWNVETGRKSVFRIAAVSPSDPLPDSLFTREALMAGRGRCYPTPCR